MMIGNDHYCNYYGDVYHDYHNDLKTIGEDFQRIHERNTMKNYGKNPRIRKRKKK